MFSTGPTSAADWRYRVCRQEVRQQQRTYTVYTRDMPMSVQIATTLSTTATDGISYKLLRRLFHIGNFCFWVPFLNSCCSKTVQWILLKCCNVCTRKAIITAGKRILNSGKICRSYCDFYFGVTFLEHTVYFVIERVRYLHFNWTAKLFALKILISRSRAA